MKYTEAQLIGDLLPQLFNTPAIAAKIAEGSLPEAWAKVTGTYVESQTRNITFKTGIMTVYIASSVVRSEMFMQRNSLRDKINAQIKAPIVKELIVR